MIRALPESPDERKSGGGGLHDAASGEESGDADKCCQPNPDGAIVDEAKLVLAEKRTAMALMRTGIAVFALPLSVLSLLIATSKYYNAVHVLNLILLLAVINLALLVLGTHLIVRALRQLRRYDRLLNRLKSGHSKIGKFIK